MIEIGWVTAMLYIFLRVYTTLFIYKGNVELKQGNMNKKS